MLVSPHPDSPVEGAPSLRHGFADTNGTRLHYVVGGSGPAVVLLHGYPYTWAVWKPLLPLLIEAGYTVIAPELRGQRVGLVVAVLAVVVEADALLAQVVAQHRRQRGLGVGDGARVRSSVVR